MNRTLSTLALGAAAALTVGPPASAAEWQKPERVRNDGASATKYDASDTIVDASLASNGRAAVVFNAKGNRLWSVKRTREDRDFGRAERAFPAVRPRSLFATGMDSRGRLALASGQTTGPRDALTAIAGDIESSKGFGEPKRISRKNGLTYAGPTVAVNPKGDVYAGFSGEKGGGGAVYVRRGTTGAGRYDGLTTLRPISGATTVDPPNVRLGIRNNGTVVAVYDLPDGTAATSTRGSDGRWTQLPAVGQPVNGRSPDAIRLDVPSSGPAVLAIAQNGDISVMRLGSDGTGWSDPETVAVAAYVPRAAAPVGFQTTFRDLVDLDVATNSSGDVAIAWGTNVSSQIAKGSFLGPAGVPEYSRSMRRGEDGAWPAPTTTPEPTFSLEINNYGISNVEVEMDNLRHAVAAYANAGADNGVDNPLAVTTWNGRSADAWSATQDFSRFCNTALGIAGPSLAAAGGKGVLVAWGCTVPEGEQKGDYAPGLLHTRQFR